MLARMAIQKRLFATSPNPATQAALSTQEAILAAIQATGSLSIGAIVRLHWYDPEAATAWLEYARSDRFSRAAIDALPSAEQNARVVELWDAFGRYWRCLNVSPYGWARFRRLCEAQWGYPSYALGQDGWLGKPNVPYMNGRWGGAWRQRAKAAIYNPTAPRGAYSPAYDRGAGISAHFFTSAGNQDFGATDIVLGTQEPYAIENAGNRPGQRGTLPDSAFAPTVEVHRVWMQRNGAIRGGYPDGLTRAYADTNTAATSEVGPAPLASLWQAFNFSEPPVNHPGRWDDWSVGFALPDAAAGVQGGALARHRRAASTDVLWTVPPLRWYWELLRGAYPLPTGYGDLSDYPNLPPVPTPTTSVLDYLARQSPEAIVREVMNDVMWRNRTMAEKNGVAEERLGSAAAQAELDNIREANTPSTVASILSGAFTAAGGIVSLATRNKAGLAAGGMVSTAIGLIDAADNEYEAVEARRTDVFGRGMPAMDTVAIVDDEAGARVQLLEAGRPGGAGGTLALPVFVSLGANADALGRGPLSVVGMPPYGGVEVGLSREVPPCAWTDASQTTWRCTIPTGPQWVRVTAPSGEARMARTETSSAAPASVEWARMYPEHRYAIRGLPPGTDVFVDGAPAMGTWADPGMGAWEVFLPVGPHAIRLVPPGGAPVLVEVRAEGARSEATWTGLVAAGNAQRIEAARGSSAGWWLAGGVTLAAVALFYATMRLDGRRANPGKRRR